MLYTILPNAPVAYAATDKRYAVKTEEEFRSALDEINAAENGCYEIILTNDIYFTRSSVDIINNTVTIYGAGHKIMMGTQSHIWIAGNAIVNLGNTDYSDALFIGSADNTRTIIAMGGTAKLNMYDNVSIGENSMSGGQAGGIQLQGNSSFHMYGGLIYNCTNWASVSGGVLVANSSTFIMDGGKIENCSGYQGGGVGIIDSGTFTMNGGEISRCSDNWYGGGGVNVFGTKASFTMNSGKITGCKAENQNFGLGGAVFVYTVNGTVSINGGEISGNSAVGCGGGVCVYGGSTTIAQQAVIYNNHASMVGDDLFNYGGGSLAFRDRKEGLILDDCNHAIDGWYVDGVLEGEDTARWNAAENNTASVFVKRYVPDGSSVSTQIALKAAHTVYAYTISYYIDGVKNDALTETGQSPSSRLEDIPNKCPEGYTLKEVSYGTPATSADGNPGSFTVEVYYTKDMKPGGLVVSKTVSGGGARATEGFSFVVTLDDATISGTYGDMRFEGGVATFMLKANESKTATGLPADTGYTVVESDNSGYTVTVNGASGTAATGTIVAGQTATAAFHNYKNSDGETTDPAPAKVTIAAAKTLDGSAPSGSGFTFLLKDESGNTVQSKSNSGGSITFDPLSFSRTGTYVYTIRELAGTDGNIAYDTTIYKVIITVTKPGDYEAAVSFEKDGQAYTGTPAFANTTKGDPATSPTPTVPDKPIDDVPKTGDGRDTGLWLVLMLCSLIGLIAVGIYGRHGFTGGSKRGKAI